jgi:XTP/dITP diphosphohydrolase
VKLLVATRSDHKLEEIRSILAPVPGLELLGLDEAGIPVSPKEDGLEPHDTFEENALSKARYFHRLSGLPTVSDDSGLAVDALGGAPGVRSKRFAPGDAIGRVRDRANNEYLIERLQGVPEAERTARYVCVVALVEAGAPARTFRGEVEGRIAEVPSGEGGFGYDPLFHVPELGRTFGDATAAEKHARSHRGRAFRALAAALRSTDG